MRYSHNYSRAVAENLDRLETDEQINTYDQQRFDNLSSAEQEREVVRDLSY